MLRATTKNAPNKTLWATPDWFYQKLNRIFNFTLDGAALPDNAKCNRFCMPAEEWDALYWADIGAGMKISPGELRHAYNDAFLTDWVNENVFLNPPFGKDLPVFLDKVIWEVKVNGALVVCLIPDDTSTVWYHKMVKPYAEVHELEGRLKFGGAKGSPNFGTTVAVYWPQDLWRGVNR